MAKKDYHKGTKLFVYLSDEAVHNLEALPGETKRARIEYALAAARNVGPSEAPSSDSLDAALERTDARDRERLRKFLKYTIECWNFQA